MTENVSDLVLDGNAAAGLLEEIFAPEITSAQVECEACGPTQHISRQRRAMAGATASAARKGRACPSEWAGISSS